MMQGGAESAPQIGNSLVPGKSEWGIFFFSLFTFPKDEFPQNNQRKCMSTKRGSNHGCHLSFVRMWRARQKAEDR